MLFGDPSNHSLFTLKVSWNLTIDFCLSVLLSKFCPLEWNIYLIPILDGSLEGHNLFGFTSLQLEELCFRIIHILNLIHIQPKQCLMRFWT